MEIHIEIQETHALKIKADVLVLKYAQDFFGADSLAFTRLALLHKNLEKKLPKPSKFLLLESLGSLASNYVLFAGVERLMKFRYKEIREFAFNSLKELGAIKPEAKDICFTMHGANYGLDETEAFEAEIAGLVDALAQGLYPSRLRKISIAEIYEPRAKRLRAVLDKLLPDGIVNVQGDPYLARRSMDTDRLISEAGVISEDKPLIFVAMPFDQKMDDIFHYADLTSSSPNVYLEVGYVWGRGVPTVLLAQDAQELKFDLKGQKCIIYSGIRELEEKLSKELLGLR